MRNIAENPLYDCIKEYKHWAVLFRQKQVTIGSVIIMSKQFDKQRLGDVSTEAWAEFATVSHEVEQMLINAFGAEKFNYLALMMYDPEVHFHVIPRYSRPIECNGVRFVDADWPDATKRIALKLDADTLEAIKQKLIATIE